MEYSLAGCFLRMHGTGTRSFVVASLFAVAAHGQAAAPGRAPAPESGLDNGVTVTSVYPSAETLPENLLRFYIYFSRPMRREGALRFVRLVDDDGRVVDGAFLSNRFDLWSTDSKRLTLLFDPGRVKTGLIAHENLGKALKVGRSYELVVDAGLRAIDDTRMTTAFRKRFRVERADSEPPDLSSWTLSVPEGGTREAFVARLNGPQDHVSLAFRVRVKTVQGESIQGVVSIGGEETEWIFTPREPWRSGRYRLVVEATLEDIVGNRMTGTFERPLREGSQPREYTRGFTIDG